MQLLQAAGLFVGEQLLGANHSNPYGHFEDREIVKFHDDLLSAGGHAWFLPDGPLAVHDPGRIAWCSRFLVRRAARAEPFGFKDPRLCLTLCMWAAMLPALHVVYVHRNPWHSITSMWQRAWVETKMGRAVEINGPLAYDRALVADIYMHNAAAFLGSYAARRPRDRFVLVAYDDIVSRRVDLPDLVNRAFDMELAPVDFDSVYDARAVTANRSPLRFDEDRERRLRALDDVMLDLAGSRDAGRPSGQDRNRAGPQWPNDPFDATGSVGADVLAYELACSQRHLRGLALEMREVEDAAAELRNEMDRMQTLLDQTLAPVPV